MAGLRPQTCKLLTAVLALLVLACLMLPGSPALAQTFPALTGRVVDSANIIPDDVEARIDQKLAALEQQSHRQLVVATLPDLQGYDISDYGYQLGRHWGIGDKTRNDGALLIIAPKERKVRIEVGYGLEPVLTDGYSTLIIQQQILPRFKAGDMPGGIEAGTDAIISQLTLPAEEAQKIAATAKPKKADSGNAIVPAAFWLLMVFLFFILPAIRRGRGYSSHQSSGLGPIILWSVLDGMSHSGGRSSGGSDWGGGGGGGFSGGGGSFGGGGASGGW
jgi:uncharacterized protein